MRILMVTFLLPHAHATNGAALSVHGALQALAGGHDVTLVTFAVVDPIERQALSRLRESGIEVHQVGARIPAPLVRWKRSLQRRSWRRQGSAHPGLASTDPRMQRALERLVRSRRCRLRFQRTSGAGMRAPT